MDMKLLIQYRMDLTREEWLVVSKALRVFADLQQTPHSDREIAAALQEQMLQQKHSALSQMTNEAGKHVANVDATKGRKT